MSSERDLFGKTFDQQLALAGKNIEAQDITPNLRIKAEILFEPVGGRVKMTVYDSTGRRLCEGDVREDEQFDAPRRIKGEVILEPLGRTVRVTARDEEHRILWGYVASKETLKQIHCLVAVYETLRGLIAEELERRGSLVSDTADPVESAKAAIAALEETTQWIKASLDVKRLTDATQDRAKAIARMVADVNRQLLLEATTLRGMKPKTEAEGEQE